MSSICIGPICIPWVSVYAILVFLAKFALDLYRKASGSTKELEQKKQNAVLRTDTSAKRVRGKRTRAGEEQHPIPEKEPQVKKVETEDDWEELLAKEGDRKLALVQFTASWCKPCQKMKGFVERLSVLYPEVSFGVVDVDSEDLFDIVQNEGIGGLPYFAAYQGRKTVDSYTGSEEEKLERMVAALG